ncbi:MAG: hypothetical protein ABSA17_08975 [Rhabdochlamydiaceae bacterium]|jgi:hypothetical protein
MNIDIKNLIVVGTATYLHLQASDSSGNKLKDRLLNSVLQASYFFYLAGDVRSSAKIDSPRFAALQRGVFLITPVLMGVSLCFSDEVEALPNTFAHICNFGSVVAGVAIRYFEGTKEAFTSVGMFAAAHISQKNPLSKMVVGTASAVSAVIAYLSFAAWIMDSSDTPLKVATVATGLLIILSKLPKLPPYQGGLGGGHSYYPGGYPPYDYGSGKPRTFPSSSTYNHYLGASFGAGASYAGGGPSSSSSSSSSSSFLQSFSSQPYCVRK